MKRPSIIDQLKPAYQFAWLLILLFSCSIQAQTITTGHPNFLSPHSKPIVIGPNQNLFVVNTPNDTVDVIDTTEMEVIASIAVGIDPVGLAIKPDGSQLWVANHISDSVNIIDINPTNPTYLQITHTIQDFDPETLATRFDEPVSIVFANNNKAYVSLSSENKIAVVDTNTYKITKKLMITAQDPRAMIVTGNRLYVIPFESNNKTQISGCVGSLSGGLCTFDATEHVVTNNNVLSQNIVVDVVKHPQVPDRDLYIFDTNNDQLIQTVSSLGTLLYGITATSNGSIYIAQTDARNDINGAAGTLGDGLSQMGNRAFLNQITKVNCDQQNCTKSFIELEPLPPQNPESDEAIATPFAIQITPDNNTLVITAASSNKLVLINANTNQIISQIEVGKVPRGLVLEYNDQQELITSWVFNAVSNSVSKVNTQDPVNPVVTHTIQLADPTDPMVKLGRIQFNDAKASTTETFSCESCHPDGGTDQLLWVLDTPACSLTGCDQIPPRITMPIRGLRDTAPYHWDGIPGDPYGGSNTANIFGFSPANCALDDPASCTRNLVDGGLASTMCQPGNCPVNDEGKPGALTAIQRDAMAQFLLSVPYPPAQRRSYNNQLSERAELGFKLFHIDGDLQGNPQPNVCGNCHRMPFWVSTNTPGTGMEAPTWRGAYDRWLILPQGRLNIIDFNFYEILTRQGTPEELMWRLSWASRFRFNPVWNMVTEGSTGFSGAFARQITLNNHSNDSEQMIQLFDSLEQADNDNAVILLGEGLLIEDSEYTQVTINYENDMYWFDDSTAKTRSELIAMAQNNQLVATLTAKLGNYVDVNHPQPALWTLGSMHLQQGRQIFPNIDPETKTLRLSGRHINDNAHIILDGQKVSGIVSCENGELPNCQQEIINIQLAYLPDQAGMHFLQVQNIDGLVSNDFIVFSTVVNSGTTLMDLSGPWYNPDQNGHGWFLEHLGPAEVGQPERLLAFWYTFSDEKPIWFVGQGEVINGRAKLKLQSSFGTGFPPEFNSNDIEYRNWGHIDFEFINNNKGKIKWQNMQTGFSPGHSNIEKIASINPSEEGCISGSYYNPEQNGHGLNIQIINTNGQSSILVAWFTYHQGEPIWLLGQGQFQQQSTLTLNKFSGTNFPPDFNTDNVTTEPWGEITISFIDNNHINLNWSNNADNSNNGNLDMIRLTQLAGHACQQ